MIAKWMLEKETQKTMLMMNHSCYGRCSLAKKCISRSASPGLFIKSPRLKFSEKGNSHRWLYNNYLSDMILSLDC